MDEKLESKTLAEYQKELALLINQHTKIDGIHKTSIPALRLLRATSLSEPLHTIYEPSICIIAQGSRIVMLGTEVFQYDPNSYLAASVHLPVSCKILEASPHKPYLCARITFEKKEIFDIIKNMNHPFDTKMDSGRGMFISQTKTCLLDAVIRLLQLLNSPDDIPLLAPLILREILYRVLYDEKGYLIKQFINTKSPSHSIAKAIQIINEEYSDVLRIEELAQRVNLNTASLHNHFKKVTAMSPLQYQKFIRLQKARELLFTEVMEAAAVGYQVGYESSSQFSREYARVFGLPPIKDVKRLRVTRHPLENYEE